MAGIVSRHPITLLYCPENTKNKQGRCMRNSWKYWGMACLAAAMTALLTAGPVLAAEKKTKTKILKYDKDGRVIGYESSDIKNKDKAGTSAKSNA